MIDMNVISGIDKKAAQIKRSINHPLIMLTLTTGCLAGINASIIKGLTMSIATSGIWGWSLLFIIMALTVGFFQIKSVNMAMEAYD